MTMVRSDIVAVGRQEHMPFIVRQQPFADLQMSKLPIETPKRLVAEAAGKYFSAPDHRSLTSSCAIGSPTETGPCPITLATPCLGSLPDTHLGRSNSLFDERQIPCRARCACPGDRRIGENKELSSVGRSIDSCGFRVRIAGQAKGGRKKRGLPFQGVEKATSKKAEAHSRACSGPDCCRMDGDANQCGDQTPLVSPLRGGHSGDGDHIRAISSLFILISNSYVLTEEIRDKEITFTIPTMVTHAREPKT